MGDNYLAQQCEYHKKRMARDAAEFRTRNLCERPEIMTTVFPAIIIEGTDIQDGECIRAQVDVSDGSIHLVRGFMKIGTIDGEACQPIAEILKNPASGGVLDLTVKSFSDLSGCAGLVIDNKE